MMLHCASQLLVSETVNVTSVGAPLKRRVPAGGFCWIDAIPLQSVAMTCPVRSGRVASHEASASRIWLLEHWTITGSTESSTVRVAVMLVTEPIELLTTTK